MNEIRKSSLTTISKVIKCTTFLWRQKKGSHIYFLFYLYFYTLFLLKRVNCSIIEHTCWALLGQKLHAECLFGSFLFKVPLSLLHCRCPCLTWPDTRRGNAFVHFDMSGGGGAPNALLSIASIQDTVCKCSCTMQLNWPMEILNLIPALFCLKGRGELVMGHNFFFLQCQGNICLQIKQWI